MGGANLEVIISVVTAFLILLLLYGLRILFRKALCLVGFHSLVAVDPYRCLDVELYEFKCVHCGKYKE